MPTALQVGEHLRRLRVGAGDGVAADHAVVGDRVDGLLRRGVDGARRDQLDDVTGVVVGGVLDPGGGPQRSLLVRPGGLSAAQSLAGELLLVQLVRQPGVGDRRLALERLGLGGADRVQPLVDLGVHPGDEERRHRLDLARCPRR